MYFFMLMRAAGVEPAYVITNWQEKKHYFTVELRSRESPIKGQL